MYVKKEDILAASHGGLDIILSYYPQAKECIHGRQESFAIREERTASCAIKQLSDGAWVVTDFGGDQVPRNAINICMEEEGISFREAIVMLASRYKVGGIEAEQHKPIYEKRKATAEEAEGAYAWVVKEEISDAELSVLGPLVTREVCARYGVYALASYSYTKNRETHIKSSTDNYPLFLIDNGEWGKIYEPQAQKQYRFKYWGKKPKDILNGLTQVQEDKGKQEVKAEQDQEAGLNTSDKLPEVVLCSGETDSYNLAAWGYPVVWLNSETAKLNPGHYKQLKELAETIYVLPDIDSTGVESAIKLGMQYNDIHIIWLPEKLKNYNDKRGHARKDFKDYAELFQSSVAFKRLVEIAMPMRFWGSYWDEKAGKTKYEFNPEYCFHFLSHNGFKTLSSKTNKDGIELVRITGNRVAHVRAKEVNHFLDSYLRGIHAPIALRNMLHRTKQLSEAQLLLKLPQVELDFCNHTLSSQFFFFENTSWLIDREGIRPLQKGGANKVWEENIIPHKVKLKDAPFRIFQAEDGGYDIEVLDTSSHYLKVLINTSRMYWKEEVEGLSDEEATEHFKQHPFELSSKRLSEVQQREQRQHLINKLFAVGYLLHRHKNPARPWAVFAMDNKVSDIGESHGGSGKSLTFKALSNVLKTITLQGRNKRLTENNHLYDRVTEYTDFLLIDDADQYFDFGFFFDSITGGLVVNPKMAQSFEIGFSQSPKFCITSNYTIRRQDPSTSRRLLYTVFSDWYHTENIQQGYKETRTIYDDVGKQLFGETYTQEEWNNDFNALARAVSFFLSLPTREKLTPPMGNVELRNLRTVMGDDFFNWAEVYFSPEGGNLNREINRKKSYEDFLSQAEVNRKHWTSRRFGGSVKSYAAFYGYGYNPEEFTGKDGRIIRRDGVEIIEYFYLKDPTTTTTEVLASDTVPYKGETPF